jgi:dTDP-4-dehydrorhamnose 3,5-epimerase
MRRLETRLDGPLLLEPVVHADDRGFFQETYRRNVLAELGVEDEFVQDNHSRSRRGVLRGMHVQPGMAKLIRCVGGEILDVVVDARPGSDSFGRWEAFELDGPGGRQVYCPDGFGHGFCVLSEEADVVYKCSAYYDPAREAGFRYDDPEVAIEWPAIELIVSERDRTAPLLRELAESPALRLEAAPADGA